jgi:group I intron endonuclease
MWISSLIEPHRKFRRGFALIGTDQPKSQTKEKDMNSRKVNARVGLIYVITNLVNGKRYVGQTILKIAKRWSLHKSDARRGLGFPFCRAIRKYGVKNFSVDVLIQTDPDHELLDHFEQMWIKFLMTHVDYGCGYNADKGGQGNRGEYSEETRLKMAETQRKLWDSLERRGEWSIAMKKLHENDPGIRIRQAERRNAYLKVNPEVPREHSEHMKALNASNPELARNHRRAVKGCWERPGYHARLRASQVASYIANPKRASDQSDFMTNRWQQDEEFRLEMSRKRTALYTNEAELQRTAAACQASSKVRNSTGYRGVSKHGAGWSARIKFKRKQISLGTHPTPEEAAIAYNKKAIELYGAGAFQNQIPGVQPDAQNSKPAK